MSKITKVFRRFPSAFWVANIMELFERWAWYGLFAVLAIYLTGSTDTGALGFSQSQKGAIMGVVTGILYLLPVVTGAIADKFGYRKILIVAYAILASGYYMMGIFTGYGAIFFTFLYVAVGAALFKPVIAATVSKTTNDTTASIGFGIYYMMVNIGGFVGPVMASKLRDISWNYLFLMSTFAILANLLLVLFIFKEPPREKNTDLLKQAILKTLKNIGTVLTDFKYVLFLLIVVGFWTMFNQIFYTLPNFIEQWVDTTVLYDALAGISPALAAAIGTSDGRIAQEMLISVDAGFIILFQVLVSSFVMRFKPLNAMLGGFLVCTIGVSIAFITGNGFYVLTGLLIFSFGEMASSPKITEYIGRIAPSDKKALYMGTSYLPMAMGNLLAGVFSGPVYEKLSDKITLLQVEMAKRQIEMPGISKNFTKNDYIATAAEKLEMTEQQLANMLWETYQPSQIWYIFAGIGIGTVLFLYLYDKFLLKSPSNSNRPANKNE